MMHYPSPQLPHINPSESGITVLHPAAEPLFERARMHASLLRLAARLLRGDRRMPALKDYVGIRPTNIAHPTVVQAVPIKQIKGSVNRCEDFDRDFYPIHDRFGWRWIRIVSMMLQGTPLPAIELIQVGQIYFVVDGHHRISAAKMLKHEVMDAVITTVYEAAQ